MDGVDKKYCLICFSVIDRRARKCPNCLHWQRAFIDIAHSRLWGVLAFLLLFSILPVIHYKSYLETKSYFAKTKSAIRTGADFDEHRDKLKVLSSKMRLYHGPHHEEQIEVTGTLQNDSELEWTDLHFEVTFFDEQGKPTDFGQEQSYGFRALPKRQTKFKLSFCRDLPREAYASHSVEILAARDADSPF